MLAPNLPRRALSKYGVQSRVLQEYLCEDASGLASSEGNKLQDSIALMTKVVRITRHPAQAAQIEALERAFGNVEVETVSETLPSDSREAVERFDELAGDAGVVEAVLPIQLTQAVLEYSDFSERGGTLIRAEMNREVDESGDAEFVFDHYVVVKEISITTRPLSSVMA